MTAHPRTTSAGFAALSVALVLLWQSAMVGYRYAGNWIGLFHTGSGAAIPPELEARKTHVVPDIRGFDGQFYRIIAHDPLLRHGFSRFVDNPALRWRRILIPGTAFLLALGQSRWIDPAFFVIILVLVFVGTYWCGRLCAFNHLHPAWGMLFLCVPAVAISIDRMTIDIALAALCAGFALYAGGLYPRRSADWRLYLVLLFAPLARETGVGLIAAFCFWLAINQQWARTLWFSTAIIPFTLWALFAARRTGPDSTSWISAAPLRGILARTLHPVAYSITSRGETLAAALDDLALLGIWVALAFAVWNLVKRLAAPLDIAGYIFAASILFLAEPDLWHTAYGFARTQSPLLMCIAFQGLRSHSWHTLLPMALAAPRIAFEMLSELKEAAFM